MNTALNQTDATSDDTTPASTSQVKAAVSNSAPAPAKKVMVKKPVARKSAIKKPVVTKVAVKKPVAKKVVAKKAPAKKSPASSVAAVKPTVQKTAPVQVKPLSVKAEASTQKVKVKKQKMVRDSFTMPELEYQILGDLKKSCLKQCVAIKKSELLRIGMALLKTMTAKQLEVARNKLEKISAGRPKKD